MSIKIKIYNQKAETVGEMNLSEKVFGVPVNEALVHQAMIAQTANERQVLAHAKGRSEVSGGGRKPWRQKGTGRARAGSNRSPIWIGGGVTFGPTKDRNFKKNINKKMRQKAILMVLSDKVKNGNLLIMDGLRAEGFKTKVVDGIIKNLESRDVKNEIKADTLDAKSGKKTDTVKSKSETKADSGKDKSAEKTKKQAKADKKKSRSLLIINEPKDEKFNFSGRNLAGVKMLNLENINIVDLLKYRDLILTKAGIKKFESIYEG